jgi:hypothetical protein
MMREYQVRFRERLEEVPLDKKTSSKKRKKLIESYYFLLLKINIQIIYNFKGNSRS